MNFALAAIIMVFAGVLILRLAGRKSISQMSLAETVVMISIGSLIVKPIVEQSVWKTVVAAGIFVAALIFMEYMQLQFNVIEKLITGKSKVIIQDGIIDVQQMRKLRITVDELEMRIRIAGISKIENIKTATLEPNGQIGYELTDEAKPLTVGEFKRLMGLTAQNPIADQTPPGDLFAELVNGEHKKPHPTKLK
ncbi:DUF421 domain-containing protein [Bacillus mesophilum]|uniref:DUF421 domain-containing protein n=1 Tax=Bacillus mesophilum TaxID=1071718 RepID=A0A7V7V194_9BACI|nr:DUF421 domain-containing protein [Bacillus mesophilum]KAB2335552.1 DUF421 domain-containing protein [Bacillus mesophilum]